MEHASFTPWDASTVGLPAARRALAKRRFHEAVRRLEAARRLCPDSGLVLGLLGWAVANDPTRPEAERLAHAVALFRLAEALGGAPPDLPGYRAAVAARQAGLAGRFASLAGDVESEDDEDDEDEDTSDDPTEKPLREAARLTG